jgi:hypothetical protein
VRTFTLRPGQAASLPLHTGLSKEAGWRDMNFIGGTLRKKGKDGAPVAGIDVAIKGTGYFTTTDQQGRFTLGNLHQGEYTLVAWLEGQKPVEKKIQVPLVEGDYDLEVS